MSANSNRKSRRARAHKQRRCREPPNRNPPSGAVPGTEDSCTRMECRATDDASQRWGPPLRWYGTSPAWRVAVEAAGRRTYGNRLRVTERSGVLEYRIDLDVHGPQELTEVVIVFAADPPYQTYGLPPQDYPRVWADRGLASKHRMPDDALCLYYPGDPPERRWTSDKGLLDLLDLVVDHLLYESYWRATGGPDGGRWLGDEAEHGLDQQAIAL